MAKLLIATATAVIRDASGRYRVTKGQVVHADDPVVQGREHLFRPLDVKYLGRRGDHVEQATAAPGEKRDLDLDPKKVREWAKANDLDVPARGKLPADVVELYQAEHADDTSGA